MHAAENQSLWISPDLCIEVHLTGEETSGAFCLLVDHPAPGWSLPAHRHRNEAETMHIIDGQFSVTIDGREQLLGPGETAHVPAGSIHEGRNVGSTTGRRMLIFSPAGLEKFFLEVGGEWPDQCPDPAIALEVGRRHGFEFVG